MDDEMLKNLKAGADCCRHQGLDYAEKAINEAIARLTKDDPAEVPAEKPKRK